MAAIKCPACQSEIESDGGTLVKKSDRLIELEELEKIAPRAQSEIERLQAVVRRQKARAPKKGGKRVVEQTEGRGAGATEPRRDREDDEDRDV